MLHLRAILGQLGPIWQPPWAILGPSWDHRGTSRGPLGATSGHLKAISGRLEAILWQLGAIWGHLGPWIRWARTSGSIFSGRYFSNKAYSPRWTRTSSPAARARFKRLNCRPGLPCIQQFSSCRVNTPRSAFSRAISVRVCIFALNWRILPVSCICSIG